MVYTRQKTKKLELENQVERDISLDNPQNISQRNSLNLKNMISDQIPEYEAVQCFPPLK